MDDTEKMNNESQQDATPTGSESSEKDSSLKGKGWDILVGGEEHAKELGGDDPFDESPEDEEIDSILSMSASGEGESGIEGDSSEDAFWDRGKGVSGPVPVEEGMEPPAYGTGMAHPSAENTALHPTSGVPVAPSGGVNEEGVIELPPLAEATGPSPSSGPLTSSSVPLDDLGPTVPSEAAPPGPAPTTGRPFTGDSEPFGGSASEIPFGSSPAATPSSEGILTSTSANASEAETGLRSGETSPARAAAGAAASALPAAFSRPDDPFASAARGAGDRSVELETDKTIQEKLVTDERVDALWEEINQVYDTAINDVRGYFSSTEAAISDLKKARELLLAGYENFDNAEELVMRVKARLRLEEKVRQWAKTRGTWLSIYLIIWLLLLSSMSIVTFQLQVAITEQGLAPPWMAATILPGLFGGLGGVVGALWVLIKHIAKKRDFDPIHTPWYVTNPFMGFALGVITYLILLVSGSLVNPGQGVTELAAEQISSGVTENIFIYALCVIVGFNQNVLWALVDRVIKAIVPPEESKATVEEATDEPSS